MDPTLDDVLEQVAKRREEFAADRFVPRDVIDDLKKIGMYRAATPAFVGGTQLPPSEFLHLVERISEVDGSTGWVASFGSSGFYLSALPPDTIARLYADGPDLVFAGALFPVQPAVRVKGGYRVSGHWKFSSGCKAADVIGVGIGTGDVGGKPRTAVLRADQVRIVENWDVVGLEGTGSHDIVVEDVFVPEEDTFVRGGPPTVDDRLFRYPPLAYAAQVLAAVNLGIGRAALDHVLRVGAGRAGITGAPRLADRAYYRIGAAKAEAGLRSARAFFYEITDEVYADIVAGKEPTDRQKATLRLAAAHTAEAGLAAVQAAYGLSGTVAIYHDHPLQRYLRDASVVTQHAFLSSGMYDSAGAVMMGLPAAPGFL
ncbi:acyl-CoA dehydrogenase family protein [Amycolatopsis jejuensis]|uniref:acyl-CoA dehydrogenase family protein n=1 Tax=Amycolatopsis jejuensis TaxID=330084 RepID=UPI00068B8DDE|nr:acyl-CoA dehydrogenase family protein [Amycolatopsis jejuensis]